MNPRSDAVRSVARLAVRSARARSGTFLAEGPQVVREALRAHGERRHAGRPPLVRRVWASPQGAQRHPDLLDLAGAAGLSVQAAADDVLAAMASTVTSPAWVAVCSLLDLPVATALAGSVRLVPVLCAVRDPGNAGTVLRSADAAGADAVILAGHSVDVHNPKCVRSTAGSLFHLPVATGADVGDVVSRARTAGLQVLAADSAGSVSLEDLQDDEDPPTTGMRTTGAVALSRPTAWLFGNEAWGLPAQQRALADAVVRVPVHGRAESLNLATAAALCLYATARAQRRAERWVRPWPCATR